MSALTVFRPNRFAALFASDAINISRDPMLIFGIVLSVVPMIAFAFTQDLMDSAALAAFGVESISRYVAAPTLVLPATLIGWVTGFLLLEDRDEGTLLALDTTPVGKSGFIAYRVAVTVLVTLVLTLVALPLVAPQLGLINAIAIAVAIPVAAVLSAVILPAIARNKVEGLALTKLTNLAMIMPLLAIIPSPLRYVAGVVPTYWVGELMGLGAPYLPLAAVIGLAIASHAAITWLLFRLLARRAG